MKAYLFILVLGVSTAMSQNYGYAGCGVGSYFPHENRAFQGMAASTNSIFFNQSSSLTSGTSNCQVEGLTQEEEEQALFLKYQREELFTDIALGKGEVLESLFDLYKISEVNRDHWTLLLKRKMPTLLSYESNPIELSFVFKTIFKT